MDPLARPELVSGGIPGIARRFEALVERIQLSEQLSLAQHPPRDADILGLRGLPGGSLAGVATALRSRVPVVVLVGRTPVEADELRADIETIAGSGTCKTLPQRETLPYEDTDPHVEVSAQRVEAISALLAGNCRLIVTTARGLVERSPVGSRTDFSLHLEIGATEGRDPLADRLRRLGFERVDSVRELGDYALRGNIVDVFPFGVDFPLRIELWDGELASIRHFDLLTQRSVGCVERAEILPLDLTAELFEESAGVSGARIERRALLELMPAASLIIECDRSGPEQRAHLWDEVRKARAETAPDDALTPSELVVPPDEAEALLSGMARITRQPPEGEPAEADRTLDVGLTEPPAIDRDMHRLVAEIRACRARGEDVLLLCDNRGQMDRLEDILSDLAGERFATGIQMALGSLVGGFRIPGADGLLVLTDHEIFRRSRRLRRSRRVRGAATLESIASLSPGDYVVHMEQGVGVYRGLEEVHAGGESIETLKIEYAGGEILRVPHYRLDLVERWTSLSDEDSAQSRPKLHKLGGKRWKATRQKAAEAIRHMAAELLELYAHRQVNPGFAFSPDTRWQREMESAFLYEDTPDQRKAWEDAKADMESPRVMDRLICGDVGYGKTEIAIRAAFKAIQDGKQVAVLAPTTILVEQHARTFSERLASFPVRVEAVSRLRTPTRQAAVLEALKRGKVDILLGTHRLLSPDVIFRDLGLLVVDEEQRFGVRHKERLKELKRSVDVLTLTATPIPRTLQLALGGLRDMSTIDTAPRDRMPVITHVLGWSDSILRDAMQRELDRGGQVFLVHDRVESIEALASRTRKLVPDARVAVAHGQMPDRELETVMNALITQEIDVLVSTSIIENGLDIPSANTMIVNRSDRFGLAQLYQLRGRVGRSHHRAYCYLLTPPTVTPDALHRLRVLEHHTELGSGYRVALKDLQIRGAGNLLGANQSGFAQAVGFETYQRLLQECVARMRGDATGTALASPQVSIEGDALLPDRYVQDSQQKMHLYRRLARMERLAEIDELEEELRDRFGPPPDAVGSLLDSARLKLLGRRVGIEWIRITHTSARVNFREGIVPRLARLGGALEDRQIVVEVRRTQPLSLVLANEGCEQLAPTLVEALGRLLAEPEMN